MRCRRLLNPEIVPVTRTISTVPGPWFVTDSSTASLPNSPTALTGYATFNFVRSLGLGNINFDQIFHPSETKARKAEQRLTTNA